MARPTILVTILLPIMLVGGIAVAAPTAPPNSIFGIGPGTLQSKVHDILGEPVSKQGDVDYEEWDWTPGDGAVRITIDFHPGDARVQDINVMANDTESLPAAAKELGAIGSDALFAALGKKMDAIKSSIGAEPTRDDQYSLDYDLADDGGSLSFIQEADTPTCYQVSLTYSYPDEIPDWAVAPLRVLQPGTEEPVKYATLFGVPINSTKELANSTIKAKPRADAEDPNNVFYTPEDAPISVNFEFDEGDDKKSQLMTIYVDASMVDQADLPDEIAKLKALGLDDPALAFLGKTKEQIASQLGDPQGYMPWSYTYRFDAPGGTSEYLEVDFNDLEGYADHVIVGVNMD